MGLRRIFCSVFFFFCAVYFCLGCSISIANNIFSRLFSKKGEDVTEVETPVEDYYRAMYKYSRGQYQSALSGFEEIEKKYPTFSYVKNAQLMQIYIQYLRREYTIAIALIENFISTYQNNEYVPYLRYMSALCYKSQISGITKTQELLYKTRNEMSSVAEVYPDTIYGAKALLVTKYLDKLIVYNSYIVGEIYQEERNYFAAIRVYLRTIDIQSASGIIDFLPIIQYRLYECYSGIGMHDLAEKYKDAFSITMQNFNGTTEFSIDGIAVYIPEHIIKTRKELKLKKTDTHLGLTLKKPSMDSNALILPGISVLLPL